MGYWKQQSDNSNARMHYLLREDIAKLDAYIADTRLLEREDINTESQLNAFYHRTSRTIEELIDERKPLYLIARRADDPESAAAAKGRTAVINNQLKQHRKELQQCDGIAKKSGFVLEKIDQIELASIEMVAREARRRGHSRER